MTTNSSNFAQKIAATEFLHEQSINFASFKQESSKMLAWRTDQ
jgi:hypothetical protein